jgi:hypothetical protein
MINAPGLIGFCPLLKRHEDVQENAEPLDMERRTVDHDVLELETEGRRHIPAGTSLRLDHPAASRTQP